VPWVRFTADFNFHVRHNVTIAYKAGMVLLVKQRCADEAIWQGKAITVDRPQDVNDAGRRAS